MPDFSQPGSDGDASVSFEPSGFANWRRGVVYTVRPEMLAPLARGQERRIGVSVRKRIDRGEPFTSYVDLYRQASAITARRVSELTCAEANCSLHARTVSHSLPVCAPRPQGEDVPTDEVLLAAGGLMKEMLAARLDEFYNDFDFHDPSARDAYMFSYGKYVPSRHGLDFAPIVERAERLARLHVAEPAAKIVRREWLSTSAPDLAVVHLYFL